MYIVTETRSPAPFTIWIRRRDDSTTSCSVWRGPRTVAALSEVLATLDANGFPAGLELESASCGPVEMTITELVDLGIVREEYPITKARAFFRSLVRQRRARRS
jgi:hypothetical protein